MGAVCTAGQKTATRRCRGAQVSLYSVSSPTSGNLSCKLVSQRVTTSISDSVNPSVRRAFNSARPDFDRLSAARSGMTSSGELLESAKRIERVGAKITGIVFNGFKPSLRSAQYGDYGGYAYLSNASDT